MNVVNSEEQKWWMITQSFDHFFLFLSYLVLLYLWNSNKAMDGLFNFPFFILLLSADLYFWSRWTLFPFSPDLINFERQSVFLKWTSRADSAALVIWLRQRRLLSCWELNNLGQPTNYISECLEQSYKIVTWELYSSHSSSTNDNCSSSKAAAKDSLLCVVSVMSVLSELQHSSSEANEASKLRVATLQGVRTVQRMEGGNKLLRIAQISEQIEWCILNQVQVLPYSELHRQEITMIESYVMSMKLAVVRRSWEKC